MIGHGPSPLLAKLRVSILSVAVLVATTQVSAAQASEPERVLADFVAAAAVDRSAEIDPDVVAEAAEQFVSGDPEAVATLVEAAAGEVAVAVEQTPAGLAAETDTGTVVVDRSGGATVTADGMPSIGMSVAGDPEAVTLVDGAVVQTEVAPSTDVVTRATDDGVQMIAILGDASAPSEIEFPIDLPDDAELVLQDDGSVTVMGTVEFEVPLAGEQERYDAAIEAVLGDFDHEADEWELSAEQASALDKIPAVRTSTLTEDTAIGSFLTPWAVDAEGNHLPTRYEVTEDGITQIIETDGSTAFPVTADPVWIPVLLIAVRVAAQITIKVGTRTIVYAVAPAARVVTALKNFATLTFRAGPNAFKLTTADMKHVLVRHHPTYWNGTKSTVQTFFDPKMSVANIRSMIHKALQQHTTALSKIKTINSTTSHTFTGTVDGVKYTMTVRGGHVTQFFPR